MIRRVEVSSDIAVLGAWDEVRGTHADWSPFSRVHLLSEMKQKHLIFFEVGSDFGGTAEVEVLAASDTFPSSPEIEGELDLPTGRLVVGGVEEYGQPKLDHELLSVTPGKYRVAIILQDADKNGTGLTIGEAMELLPLEDQQYYSRSNHLENWGSIIAWLSVLLFPILLFFINWKWALCVSVAVLITSSWAWELTVTRRHKHDDRLKDINQRLHNLLMESGNPLFRIILRQEG